ncbi:M15 family metallopeptidase [Oerskovia rustica]|uniref:D-alanyl-D-alanine carboxypeptidase family protein n=1 Tax=Oerskovia rustica TaxID=2762237 RepID=A0ABR8RNK5_9CELL|nr:M15 family metallopeptidase [Oerskovia rustica]MBD7949343.1 D-alanyl-D-alanine carboxypeptidase family protein [Oerskovia rustica]
MPAADAAPVALDEAIEPVRPPTGPGHHVDARHVRRPARAVPMILSSTLVLGSVMTVGFVGSSITHRESWSVQYAAEEPVAGAAFGVQPPAYEPPSEDVQLDRVVKMLDRSDEVIGADAAVSETVLQARSELGMLLATYQAQQAAAGGGQRGSVDAPGPVAPGALPGEGLATPPAAPDPLTPTTPDAPDAPAAPGAPGVVDGQAPTAPPATGTPSTVVPVGPGVAPAATPVAPPPTSPDDGPGAADAQATDLDPGTATDGTATAGAPTAPAAPAGGAGDGFDPETGLPSEPAPDPGDPTDDEAPSHEGLVTIDDVVAAATRLAELMGPAYALAAVGVVPADGAVPTGDTLADQLAAAVAKYADSTSQYANGQLPDSVLCPLAFAPGQSLRCDAAEQLEALAAEYQKAFGKPLRITDSYRSYDDQVAVKAAKPFLAAVPGTSQHGWGLAIDVGSPVSTGKSAEYLWMRLHAPDYGWDNPTWARPDGRKPEPWHFEFYAAGAMPDRYTPGAEGTPTAPPSPTAPTSPTSPPAPAPSPTTPVPTPTPTTPAPTDPPTTPAPSPTTPSPTESVAPSSAPSIAPSTSPTNIPAPTATS